MVLPVIIYYLAQVVLYCWGHLRPGVQLLKCTYMYVPDGHACTGIFGLYQVEGQDSSLSALDRRCADLFFFWYAAGCSTLGGAVHWLFIYSLKIMLECVWQGYFQRVFGCDAWWNHTGGAADLCHGAQQDMEGSGICYTRGFQFFRQLRLLPRSGDGRLPPFIPEPSGADQRCSVDPCAPGAQNRAG